MPVTGYLVQFDWASIKTTSKEAGSTTDDVNNNNNDNNSVSPIWQRAHILFRQIGNRFAYGTALA